MRSMANVLGSASASGFYMGGIMLHTHMKKLCVFRITHAYIIFVIQGVFDRVDATAIASGAHNGKRVAVVGRVKRCTGDSAELEDGVRTRSFRRFALKECMSHMHIFCTGRKIYSHCNQHGERIPKVGCKMSLFMSLCRLLA